MEGFLSYDTIGFKSSRISNQIFICAYNDGDIEGTKSAGVLGLDPLAFYSTDGLLFNLKDQVKVFNNWKHLIDKAIFSFYISKTTNKSDSELVLGKIQESEKSLGGLNPTRSRNKTIHYHKLISSNRWMIEFDSLKFDSYKVTPTYKKAVMDTGTSWIMAPTSKEIYYYIQAILWRYVDTSTGMWMVVNRTLKPKYSIVFLKIKTLINSQ